MDEGLGGQERELVSVSVDKLVLVKIEKKFNLTSHFRIWGEKDKPKEVQNF